MATKKNKATRPFTKVDNEFIRNNDLPPADFFLYLYLRTFNPCYPSYAVIHRDTGLSNQTISNAIKNLVSCRLITYERGNSAKKANRYYHSEKQEVAYITHLLNEVVSEEDNSSDCMDTPLENEEDLLQEIEPKKKQLKKKKEEEQVKQTSLTSQNSPDGNFEAAMVLVKYFQGLFFQHKDSKYYCPIKF